MWPTARRASPRGACDPMDDRSEMYLIFRLGSEAFGTRVRKVREIMGMPEVTPVPHTPESLKPGFLKGVIRLQGKVIPVIDLRLKFGLPAAEYTPRTCIIVVRTQLGESQKDQVLMGIVVDEVAEVLTLVGAAMGETPHRSGMVKADDQGNDKVKILLDRDLVLNRKELRGLNALMR